MPETLSPSQEDYLEAIYQVVEEKHVARSKDIAERLQVRSSSVTGALRALSERALINYQPYANITLTPEGERLGKEILRRHEALRDFFVRILLLDETEAEETACRMEHAMPRSLLERFIHFLEFVTICPRGGEELIAGFSRYCHESHDWKACRNCLTKCLKSLEARMADGGPGPRPRSPLDRLGKAEWGRVVDRRGNPETLRRLDELGLEAGAMVEVERADAQTGEMDIKVKGYHVPLRMSEAADIDVERLQPS